MIITPHCIIGLKIQMGGFWLGCHYSDFNKRVCINLIPCVTIWVALKNGRIPHD